MHNSLTRRIAQGLWWIGFVLIVGGVTLLVAQIRLSGGIMPGALALGGGVSLLGLNMLLAGDLAIGGVPRPYSVRGPVVRGHLEAYTGLSDLTIGQCGPDRIASVLYGPMGKPGFEVVDGVAELRLNQTLAQPNIAVWRADLAGNVLWDIDARSTLGELSFDLTQLRLERIRVQTTLARLSIICPIRGYIQMELKSLLGEIELRIPEQVGVKIAIKRGGLATLNIKNKRLLELTRDRYMTGDYESAPTQIDIQINTLAGDILLT